MKAKIKTFPLLLILLLSGGKSYVWGEKFSIHANGGISFPKEENLNSGFESGFGFAFSVNKKISVSFDFGFWKSQVNEKPENLLDGKLSVTPFLASIQYSLFEKENFVLYVYAGAGYIFYDFKIGDIVKIPEITISQKVENGPALHAGLGGQVHVMGKLAIFAEALYLYREAKGKTTISDMNFGTSSEEFSLDMSALLFLMGIKYYF